MVPLTKCRYLKSFNFFKNFIRNNSANLSDNLKPKNEEETENKTHIYKKQMTHDEVIKFLLDNVVYNEDGFIVTNKPYGIGKKKPRKKLASFVPQTFNDLFLEDMMEELAEKLSVKSLKIAKAPERYASGMMIFTSTDKAQTKITKSTLAAQEIYQYTYVVVTLGQLVKEKLETKFAMTDQGSKDPVILEKWSKNNLKSKNFMFFRWSHKVLAVSQFASLVQVDISNIHWNSLRFYMATKCLSPILGDILFSYRVQEVMGVPLLVHPSSSTPKTHKKLEPELLSALQIRQNEVQIIPTHIHLQSINLPLRKCSNFPKFIPPPESFTWTCEQLELLEKS